MLFLEVWNFIGRPQEALTFSKKTLNHNLDWQKKRKRKINSNHLINYIKELCVFEHDCLYVLLKLKYYF